MTTHRPHPITGPWPYTLHPADEVRRDVHGTEPALVDRIPVDGTAIYDDPEGAVLFDACERCEEISRNPLTTSDPERGGRLWERMIEVERNDGGYRTEAEGDACRALYRVALFIERTHPGIDPWRWPWTFRVIGQGFDGGFPLNAPWYMHETDIPDVGLDEEG